MAGVLDDALLVMVEIPTYTRADIDFLSVNPSGPPALAQQRAGWRIEDLVLIEEP